MGGMLTRRTAYEPWAAELVSAHAASANADRAVDTIETITDPLERYEAATQAQSALREVIMRLNEVRADAIEDLSKKQGLTYDAIAQKTGLAQRSGVQYFMQRRWRRS